MPLNFGGRKRSGAFDTVWPSANLFSTTTRMAREKFSKGAQTSDLLIWSQPRCHCAMAPARWRIASGNGKRRHPHPCREEWMTSRYAYNSGRQLQAKSAAWRVLPAPQQSSAHRLSKSRGECVLWCWSPLALQHCPRSCNANTQKQDQGRPESNAAHISKRTDGAMQLRLGNFMQRGRTQRDQYCNVRFEH